MSSAPPKRLVIKTLKRTPAALPDDFYASTWATLRDFVRAVHAMRAAADFSYEQLYQAVTNLVIAKHGAALYAGLVAEIDAHVAAVLDGLLAVGAASDAAAFLAALQAAWALHTSQVTLVKNVFLYLDTTYIRDTPGAHTIW